MRVKEKIGIIERVNLVNHLKLDKHKGLYLAGW